jgi:hypothetical protein
MDERKGQKKSAFYCRRFGLAQRSAEQSHNSYKVENMNQTVAAASRDDSEKWKRRRLLRC